MNKWEKLEAELITKAAEARGRAKKLGYKHTDLKQQYNSEASIYERCAARIKETLNDGTDDAGTSDLGR